MDNKYTLKPRTLFEDFGTIGQWSLNTGGGSSQAATTEYGETDLRSNCNAGAASASVKTISADFSDVQQFVLKVFLTDQAITNGITLYLSTTTNFASYFSKKINQVDLRPGWNYITFSRSMFASSGTPSWDDTFVRMQVRIDANSGSPSAIWAKLWTGGYDRPKLMIDFDDGWDSVYDTAAEILDAYNLKANIFVCRDLVGDANYMTEAEINELYEAGWDVCNHTTDHTGLGTLDYADQAEKVVDNENYLKSKGWTRRQCHKHFAFPLNSWNADAFKTVADNCLTGRLTGVINTNNNVLNDGSKFALRAFDLSNTVNLTTAKSYIDMLIGTGGNGILLFHKIVTTPGASTEWPTADFQSLIDYIMTKSTQLDVVTRSAWYKGLTS